MKRLRILVLLAALVASFSLYSTTTGVNKAQQALLEAFCDACGIPTTTDLRNLVASTVTLSDAQTITGAKSFTASVKQVGGITTSGAVGTPAIVATGRATAQVAANASVSTFTVGAADASFEVSANVLVTTATAHAFTVTCAYTDEGNTARTLTMTFGLVAGGVATTSIANANGAVPYMGVPLHIRAKSGTAITIATAAGGTYTTVTYNVEGIIKQTA